MGDVVELGCITALPLSDEKVLQKAIDHGVEDVVILGYHPNGSFYFSSAQPDGGDVLWLLEMAKKRLLDAGGE